jgi:hypothetical protein
VVGADRPAEPVFAAAWASCGRLRLGRQREQRGAGEDRSKYVHRAILNWSALRVLLSVALYRGQSGERPERWDESLRFDSVLCFRVTFTIAHGPQFLGGELPHRIKGHLLDAALRSDPQTDVLRVLIEHPSRSVYVRLLIYVPSHMELKRGRFAEADSVARDERHDQRARRHTWTANLDIVCGHGERPPAFDVILDYPARLIVKHGFGLRRCSCRGLRRGAPAFARLLRKIWF